MNYTDLEDREMTKNLTTEEREKLTVLLKAAAAYLAAHAAYLAACDASAAYLAACDASASAYTGGSDTYQDLLSAYERASSYKEGVEVLKEGLER
jgi:hypothetical protein